MYLCMQISLFDWQSLKYDNKCTLTQCFIICTFLVPVQPNSVFRYALVFCGTTKKHSSEIFRYADSSAACPWWESTTSQRCSIEAPLTMEVTVKSLSYSKIKPELIWILWHINLVQAAIRRYTLCMDLVWSSAVLSEMFFCIHCMLKMVIWITAAFLSVQSRTVAHWIFSLFRLLSLKSRGGCVGKSHQISSFWSFSPSSDNNHGMCKVP